MNHNVLQAVSALILLLFTALPTQAAEEVTYYHNDQLGSPIAATDSSGALLWEQAYDPWGYKLTSTTNQRAYTGHWEDPDTGLSDYQARWYSPTIGRFTRMDPVVWDENNVRSFNRYAYANNSPYRYTDPDGNIPLDTLWDAGNVLWDVGKITVGLITSNEQLVSDGKIDLAADSLAMAVPYLPAGASKLAKLGDGMDDAAGVANGAVHFKRWKRGDAIDKPLKDGSDPSFDVVRSRYWKNRYEASKDTGEFSKAQLRRMRRGSAPKDYNPRTGQWESRELHHHIPQRNNGPHNPINLREVTPDQHRTIDSYRK